MSDLYGRDDVAGPLEFQRQVVGAVLEGFRPRRPRLRGGLPPTVDIDVALPCVPGASDMPPVGANPVPPAEHDTSSGLLPRKSYLRRSRRLWPLLWSPFRQMLHPRLGWLMNGLRSRGKLTNSSFF